MRVLRRLVRQLLDVVASVWTQHFDTVIAHNVDSLSKLLLGILQLRTASLPRNLGTE
jgi:hypothetical protein